MEGVRGKGQESANQEHPRIVLLCESIEFACVLIAGQGPSPPPCLQALHLDGSLHPAGGQVKLLSSTIRAVMLPWVPISCAALPGSSAPQDVLAGSCSAPRWEHSKLWLQPCLAHCISPGCWSTEVFTFFLGVRRYVFWFFSASLLCFWVHVDVT